MILGELPCRTHAIPVCIHRQQSGGSENLKSRVLVWAKCKFVPLKLSIRIGKSMAKSKRKTKRKSNTGASKKNSLKAFLADDRVSKIFGLALLLFAAFLLIAFSSYLFTWKADQSEILHHPWSHLFDNTIQSANSLGRLGAIASHQFFYSWFGLSSFLFVLLFSASGINLSLKKKIFPVGRIYRYTFFFLLWGPTSLSYLFYPKYGFPYGGALGKSVDGWMQGFLGYIGTGLFLLFALVVFLVLVFNIDLGRLFSRKQAAGKDADTNVQADENLSKDIFEREDMEYSKEEVLEVQREHDAESPKLELEEILEPGTYEVQETDKPEPPRNDDLKMDIETGETEEESKTKLSTTNYDPTLDLPNYKYPTIDLLEDYGDHKIKINTDELEKNKDQIIETLNNYNIKISKIKATVGPTVTLYEIVPAPGVRISKIKNLEDDIALSLAALGIRIIAPIPGKGTIGIEVPNAKKEIVAMRSLLSSEKFLDSKMDLPIALGKNISNENYIGDLAKMPHLLMAGATGQGKSVGINAILISLLYKKHPSQLKLILIDPKKVELSLYKAIEKHFLAKLPDDEDAIITDTKKVVNTLNALCIEMDDRYNLLKEAHVRNIKEYNLKFVDRKLNPEKGHRFLPFFVLVIDEFADLIMTAGKEIEMPIARLAQLARAVGIHLVIATQRPSVNIITGTIKANFPARIAFKVTSKVDSRTILDIGGAEQLIGRGDMLLSVGGHMIRLQCAFVDTHEVEKVVDKIGEQKGYSEPFLLPEYVSEEDKNLAGGLSPAERDELFEDAARVIVQHQQGSTSLIQRRLKLGYNRAGRIIDQLEQAGIVGPHEGSKAREVMIKTEYELEQFLKNLEED